MQLLKKLCAATLTGVLALTSLSSVAAASPVGSFTGLISSSAASSPHLPATELQENGTILPPDQLKEFYGSVEEAPAFLGGEKKGQTTETVDILGEGTIAASIDHETGVITTTFPDGKVETSTAEQDALALYNNPEQLQSISEGLASIPSLQNAQTVCTYLVGTIGAGASMTLDMVLVAISLHPLLRALAAGGQAAFMTWIANNC